MTVSRVLFWLVVTALGSWTLTGLFRMYALSRHLVDVPNGRSSHSVPTPRGGGAAIVVATSAALLGIAPPWMIAGGLLVAFVGFVDDHRSVLASIRLAAHFAVGLVVVIGVGGGPVVDLWPGMPVPPILVDAAIVFYVAAMINLTNFMDGIDGIAACQAISVCVIGGVLGFASFPDIRLWQPTMAVAVATGGFLIWNWPPARVFMGDVGSNFIGYMVSVFTIQSLHLRPELGVAWIILSAVFVTDTTVTLLRRAWQRQILYEAHRTHAYQHLARRFQAHRPVTVGVLAMNVFYLAPLAWCVATDVIDGVVGLVLAYVPMVGAALFLRAGLPPVITPAGAAAAVGNGVTLQDSRD